jgi:hypothetical protein
MDRKEVVRRLNEANKNGNNGLGCFILLVREQLARGFRDSWVMQLPPNYKEAMEGLREHIRAKHAHGEGLGAECRYFVNEATDSPKARPAAASRWAAVNALWFQPRITKIISIDRNGFALNGTRQ